MEENTQGYDPRYDEGDGNRPDARKSIRGYRIVIIILAVILAAI